MRISRVLRTVVLRSPVLFATQEQFMRISRGLRTVVLRNIGMSTSLCVGAFPAVHEKTTRKYERRDKLHFGTQPSVISGGSSNATLNPVYASVQDAVTSMARGKLSPLRSNFAPTWLGQTLDCRSLLLTAAVSQYRSLMFQMFFTLTESSTALRLLSDKRTTKYSTTVTKKRKKFWEELIAHFPSIYTDRRENEVSSSSSVTLRQ
jgi:hypothetical protein